ncbi:MAG TPA: hypothetical protein VGO60_03800 [Iamia sp.]|nr:hypothetical protein [Iamia sp.]
MSAAPEHSVPSAPDDGGGVVGRFLAGRLDSERWDHRAHLLVCHHLLAVEGGPAAALARLRPLIQAHNARVGLRTGRGYHETITCYFIGAVDHAAVSVDGLMAVPTLARTAPGRHWSPTALGSPEAAAGWVRPDRAPLPWVWPPADRPRPPDHRWESP